MSVAKFEELNLSSDVAEKYLQDGPMTRQFLTDPALDAKMAKARTDKEKVQILYAYIHLNTIHPRFASRKYKSEHKFQRTASEIWQDRQMTGCTDYALVFCSLARKYGLPTTFLDTLEEGCLKNIQAGKDVQKIYGHAFCECLVDGKWQLLDPTLSITEKNYNPEDIKLSWFHRVAGKRSFIPIARELDTGRKRNVRDHNNELKCMVVGDNSKFPRVMPVSKEDLAKEGYGISKNNFVSEKATHKISTATSQKDMSADERCL